MASEPDDTAEPDPAEHEEQRPLDASAELRTIAFRLRELQRLASVRVKQENRRLTAANIDPVREGTFLKNHHSPASGNRELTGHLVSTLSDLDVFEEASVTLVDGTTVEGRVNPIRYTPGERLRLEIRPLDESADRYEVRTEHRGDEWQPLKMRRRGPDEEDWNLVGEVDALRTLE